MDDKKKKVVEWFSTLRDMIVDEFFVIESEYSSKTPDIKKKKWERSGGGGGESIIISGSVFEKAGINFSTVHGKLEESYVQEVLGADKSEGGFWATGVSVIVHPMSPFVPAIHMNTRFISTSCWWFGGGTDLTPTYENEDDTAFFHDSLCSMCDKFDSHYYEKFKKNCDDYFYLHHRKEPRGVGGIFYDYLQGDFESSFAFTQAVGRCFLSIYPVIVKKRMHIKWNQEDKDKQLIKRGRYVEFNLLWDRGVRFGVMTGGNPDAIMACMPPIVRWE